jgi:hypothetical protein
MFHGTVQYALDKGMNRMCKLRTIRERVRKRLYLIITGIIFLWSSTPMAGSEALSFGYTYQRADGNRFIVGKGNLPYISPIDIRLDGRPVWLVAASDDDAVIWVAVLENGETRAFRTSGSAVDPIDIEPSKLPRIIPPLLIVQQGKPRLLEPAFRSEAADSHPVFLPQTGKTAVLFSDGRLILRNGSREGFSIDALPDARLIFDERERVLLLTGRTQAYRHGVLGDTIEAQSVTLITTYPDSSAARIIELTRGSVIESTAPIWSDLDGDGVREIILTVSDKSKGSRFMVYNEDGALTASGPAVGKGFRWRHQIAVAPFGPKGELELVGVRTPHIGGVVEFFRLEGEKLRRTAHIEGFSSHIMGLRNLDMAAAGDFDGDGRVELLVPLQSLDSLAAVRHTEKGAQRVWELPLKGKLSTNLAAVTSTDGIIAVGVGSEEGILRLWLQD